ncbi:hypothetical protein P3S68_033657 [Capsicum galapagoense]
MQIAVLPIGKFMAATLPKNNFPLFGRWGSFSLNPGPFNIKEHVVITVMANCGVSIGGGDAYSIGAITVMRAYYKQSVGFLCSLIIVLDYTASGHKYDTTKIFTPQFHLNISAYEKYSKLYLSPLFALSIGSGFAWFTATLTHVALFQGSTVHALSFSADLKLGHYMKIPPRCMYTAQLVGTLVAGTINLAVAWWMLGSIENICDVETLHPDSPWTCPKFRVTFDASVIWGLIGPQRLFCPGGLYRNLVWLFLIGALLPVPIWVLSKIFPEKKWIPLINIRVVSYGFAGMPPATPTNIASWLITGMIFNYSVFKHRKEWWKKYN